MDSGVRFADALHVRHPRIPRVYRDWPISPGKSCTRGVPDRRVGRTVPYEPHEQPTFREKIKLGIVLSLGIIEAATLIWYLLQR